MLKFLLFVIITVASIGFDRLEYDVIENAVFANITIRLTGMTNKEIVVLVSTADGSAICTFEFLPYAECCLKTICTCLDRYIHAEYVED